MTCVTRPDGANVIVTWALPEGCSGSRQLDASPTAVLIAAAAAPRSKPDVAGATGASAAAGADATGCALAAGAVSVSRSFGAALIADALADAGSVRAPEACGRALRAPRSSTGVTTGAPGEAAATAPSSVGAGPRDADGSDAYDVAMPEACAGGVHGRSNAAAAKAPAQMPTTAAASATPQRWGPRTRIRSVGSSGTVARARPHSGPTRGGGGMESAGAGGSEESRANS